MFKHVRNLFIAIFAVLAVACGDTTAPEQPATEILRIEQSTMSISIEEGQRGHFFVSTKYSGHVDVTDEFAVRAEGREVATLVKKFWNSYQNFDEDTGEPTTWVMQEWVVEAERVGTTTYRVNPPLAPRSVYTIVVVTVRPSSKG